MKAESEIHWDHRKIHTKLGEGSSTQLDESEAADLQDSVLISYFSVEREERKGEAHGFWSFYWRDFQWKLRWGKFEESTIALLFLFLRRMALNNLPLNPHAPAAIPAIGDLDLGLQLGQPGVKYWSHQNIDWQSLDELIDSNFKPHQFPLSPVPTTLESIKQRIWLKTWVSLKARAALWAKPAPCCTWKKELSRLYLG